MKSKTVIQECEVRWSLHGEPPQGLPRVLASELIEAPAAAGARLGELGQLYRQTIREVPRGYALCWSRHEPPPKRWSQEARAKVRRSSLERRAKARYPLFADQIIERELADRPDYYAGFKDTAFQEEADRRTHRLYEALRAGRLGVQVFYRWWSSTDSFIPSSAV